MSSVRWRVAECSQRWRFLVAELVVVYHQKATHSAAAEWAAVCQRARQSDLTGLCCSQTEIPELVGLRCLRTEIHPVVAVVGLLRSQTPHQLTVQAAECPQIATLRPVAAGPAYCRTETLPPPAAAVAEVDQRETFLSASLLSAKPQREIPFVVVVESCRKRWALLASFRILRCKPKKKTR